MQVVRSNIFPISRENRKSKYKGRTRSARTPHKLLITYGKD